MCHLIVYMYIAAVRISQEMTERERETEREIETERETERQRETERARAGSEARSRDQRKTLPIFFLAFLTLL